MIVRNDHVEQGPDTVVQVEALTTADGPDRPRAGMIKSVDLLDLGRIVEMIIGPFLDLITIGDQITCQPIRGRHPPPGGGHGLPVGHQELPAGVALAGTEVGDAGLPADLHPAFMNRDVMEAMTPETTPETEPVQVSRCAVCGSSRPPPRAVLSCERSIPAGTSAGRDDSAVPP